MNATKIPMKTAVMTPAWAKRTLSADDEDVISGAFSTIACDGDDVVVTAGEIACGGHAECG